MLARLQDQATYAWFAEGVALPSLVDVELRGIPAHAWEMSTAESLLNPYGWPQFLHQYTRNRDDYSMFRLSAWCFNPTTFPASRDLHIAKHPVGDILSPPGKPTLRYPVSFKVSKPGIDAPSAPSEGGNDSDQGGRRRRHRRGPSPQPVVPHTGEQDAGAIVVRIPVRDRLGPNASGARLVARFVEAGGSSS